MSTHSNIGILGEDGKIEAVYCHNDGYLSGVGATLFFNYQEEGVKKLIKGGALSAFCSSSSSTFYIRDGGESLHDSNRSRTYSGITDYCHQSHNYFYDPKKKEWFFIRQNNCMTLASALMRDGNISKEDKGRIRKFSLKQKINEIIGE